MYCTLYSYIVSDGLINQFSYNNYLEMISPFLRVITQGKGKPIVPKLEDFLSVYRFLRMIRKWEKLPLFQDNQYRYILENENIGITRSMN